MACLRQLACVLLSGLFENLSITQIMLKRILWRYLAPTIIRHSILYFINIYFMYLKKWDCPMSISKTFYKYVSRTVHLKLYGRVMTPFPIFRGFLQGCMKTVFFVSWNDTICYISIQDNTRHPVFRSSTNAIKIHWWIFHIPLTKNPI